MMTQTGEAHRLPVLKERHLPGECRQSVTELLKETYGYDGFRNLEIYDDLFKNRDTLCISQGQLVENVIREAEKAYKGGEQPDNILLTAPTGAGKSLLFQLPAIYLGKEYNLLTIVVSPLKALIVDQVEGLQDVGYERVAYASSDLSPEQKMEVYRAVREGEIDLFYLSPELLLSYDIRHFIGNRRIGMVVVDEAHTVTTWGKEFRVDYWFLGRYLDALKQNLGYSFPLFALTATAVWNPKGGNDMVFDTIRSLQMEPCILYVGTVRRKNIGFDIRRLTLEEGETYDKGKQRVISGRVEEFLMEVYRMKGKKEEILVSLSDFEFVVKLPRTKNKLEYEAELGQLIKTALLWLEDDLEQRYGIRLLEVSPQNLLTEGYIQDKTGDAFAREFQAYLTGVDGEEGVYRARLDTLWEERFPELGYREFKQKLNSGMLWEGSRAVSVGKHEVLLKEDATVIRQRMDALFKSLVSMLKTALLKSKGRFDEEELRAVFAEHGMDVPSAKRFIGSLLESRTEEGRSVSYISSVKKKDSNELSFTVTKGFDLLLSRYQKLFAQRIAGNRGDRLQFYCTPFSDLNMLLNLLSMLDCLSFSVEGGGTPCVHVRFDNPELLQQLADSDEYHNLILDTNERIFEEQIELFSFFFGTDTLTDSQRWDFVEEYFTGTTVEELKKKYGGSRPV